jgi:hypothetical protein
MFLKKNIQSGVAFNLKMAYPFRGKPFISFIILL